MRCLLGVTQPLVPLQKRVLMREQKKLLGLAVVKAPPPSCRHGDVDDKRGNEQTNEFYRNTRVASLLAVAASYLYLSTILYCIFTLFVQVLGVHSLTVAHPLLIWRGTCIGPLLITYCLDGGPF